MDLRIFIEPQQGASYDGVLGLARAAERLGFDGFFTSDHLLRMGDTSGEPGPLEAWTTLAGLSRDTERLRLGTLVTPVTFRRPGVLAVTAAQVDHMSGGRLEIGLGAGWYEDEHKATAVPFPPISDRFDALHEALEIITGLWQTPEGELFDYAGTHFQIARSPGLPKPAQRPRPPLILGGWGKKRTPVLAARFADEFNLPFADVDAWRGQVDVVRDAADRELVWSAAQVVCCGSDEAEFERRAAAIGREPDELRGSGVCGLPQECADKLAGFAAAGADRVYLQVLDIADTEHLELLATLMD